MSYSDRDKYGMYRKTRSTGPGPALMGADTLIGDSVVNAEDENLGEIKEIMLDTLSGQVAYVVLAFGGFLGLGEKLFAVPWQALHLDTENKRMVLNVDKERLKEAPGFTKDAWPDMSDLAWANGVHEFYGTSARSHGGPTMGPGAGSSRFGSGGASVPVTGGAVGAGMGAGAAGSDTHTDDDPPIGAGSAHGDSYGIGASADPRPGHEGDDKDLSRIRGSNIG